MPHLPSRTWIRALVGITVALGTFEATRRYRQLASAPALSDTSRALGIDGHHVQAGPWRLFTRSVGAADAPVVVLVHGLVISSRYMEPLARALADMATACWRRTCRATARARLARHGAC